MPYLLYVIDEKRHSVLIRDTHNSHGNRSWLLPENEPFTIVLEHKTMRTRMVLDENGDMRIEQERIRQSKPPTPKKPKRRSRFLKPKEYVPGSR